MFSESQLQHGVVHANGELYPVKSVGVCIYAVDQSACDYPTLYFVIELSKRYEATHIFIIDQPSFQRSQVYEE